MNHISNKIEAKDYSIRGVLDNKKYTIDYFQREYKWEQRHIEQLIADLCGAFLNHYRVEDARKEVLNYNSYYLGPVVLSDKDGKKSVIDGQQRLTSLSLLLLYVNNLQKGRAEQVRIEPLIYSEQYGEKSFNLDVPDRRACLEDLFQVGNYTLKDRDNESVRNMTERYDNIDSYFPTKLKENALPFFIDWLVDNVVLVVITAYSDDNAYTIFETMNDRGLKLTATEMLKGYVLSKVNDDVPKRTTMDKTWKEEISRLHSYSTDEDLKFFQAWLRAKYAHTIRQSVAGAVNEDFEKIGTRFHIWVKESSQRIKLTTANEAFGFVQEQFVFYSKLYCKIHDAQEKFTPGLEHLYYQYHCGIATSLADPLLIAPINMDDTEAMINQKLNLVARFIEIFAVYRAVNYRNFSHSSIRYTMYRLVLEIRNKSAQEVGAILKDVLAKADEGLSGIQYLRMHKQNKWFIKFLLCRITAHVEKKAVMSTSFATYFDSPGGRPFEIEHIWADKMEYHLDEFTQKDEFNYTRNKLGDLLLLPQGTNQSFSDDPYQEKLPHYLKQNLLAQSLHPVCYQKNPNFLNYVQSSGLPFKFHQQFKVQDLEERQVLYQRICEEIYALQSFDVN